MTNLNDLDHGDRFHIMETVLDKLNDIFKQCPISADFGVIDYSTKIMSIMTNISYVSAMENWPAPAEDYAPYIVEKIVEAYDLDDDSIDIIDFNTVGDLIDKILELSPSLLQSDTVKNDAVNETTNETEIMGAMMIPSLESHGRFMTISNISLAEARKLVSNFITNVVAERKIKTFGDGSHDFDVVRHAVIFDNMTERDMEDINDTIEGLAYSNRPGIRGVRPLFLSTKHNVIAVGTTIVYNKNWASINYSDPDTFERILKIQN